MEPPLKIDVVSDIVCPWCFIGKRKLDVALADLGKSEPALGVEVRWHPFQLNPDLPAEGMSRASYVEQKFGGAARAAQVYARVTSAGEAAGISFRFDRIERQPEHVRRSSGFPRTLSLHCSKAVILLNCEHENYADSDEPRCGDPACQASPRLGP